MVKNVRSHGGLSKATLDAFRAVDRGYFAQASDTTADSSVYQDMPYRGPGLVHMSAPSIYATALEESELAAGLSFLNVGSGTGYLSALVAQLIGSEAIHHGVEIHPQLVEHSRAKLDELGLNTIELHACSCLAIDSDKSMRFDRIYVGAGASSNCQFLFSMLKVGGVMVGPFAGRQGQRLLKLRRLSETEFKVRELLAVQFTPLLQPPRPPNAPLLALLPPSWNVTTHRRFPAGHHSAVVTLLLCHGRGESLLSTLPKELLLEVIFPLLGEQAFHRPKPHKPHPSADGASSSVLHLRDSSGSVSIGAVLSEDEDVDESESDGSEEEEDEDEDVADDVPAPPSGPQALTFTNEPSERRSHVLGRLLRMLGGSSGAMACR